MSQRMSTQRHQYAQFGKVNATLKILRPSKSTWSGARFVRENPGEVESENQKRSQRNKRARFYSPQLGRFISRDPLGFVDGMSLYRAYFVPKGIDPFGLDWKPTGAKDPDGKEIYEVRPGFCVVKMGRPHQWTKIVKCPHPDRIWIGVYDLRWIDGYVSCVRPPIGCDFLCTSFCDGIPTGIYTLLNNEAIVLDIFTCLGFQNAIDRGNAVRAGGGGGAGIDITRCC